MAKIIISELPVTKLEEKSLLIKLSPEEIAAINGGGWKGAIIGGIVGGALGGLIGIAIGVPLGQLVEEHLK